jgi:hypothetical protein
MPFAWTSALELTLELGAMPKIAYLLIEGIGNEAAGIYWSCR